MSSPRKLLSISHSYGVGLNRRLLHELAREGHGQWEVTGVSPAYFHGANDLRPITYQPGEPGTEPFQMEVVPARLTQRVHVFTYASRLGRILREGGWDMVHAWEEPYILVGGQIAFHTPAKIPLVFATFQNQSKRYPIPFNWIERYAMHRSAGWIALGETEAATLKERRGYRDKPTKTIVTGVDTEAFKPDRSTGEHVRRSLGWEESGPPVVGYLGRFTEAKGVPILMDALDAVAQTGVAWRALFVGAGLLKPELDAWAARHGDRVRICTDVQHDAVPRYLNAMDVLAAPSLTTPKWREQFGRMLIEAFACGVPVIGSDSGEIPFVIGDAGVILPEGDVVAWTRGLGMLLDSADRRCELGRAGLERAASRFAWPVVARQYLEFFAEILQCRNKTHSRFGLPGGEFH